MKVFDLACTHDHRFEGWFSSSEDFDSQLAKSMIECPVCASRDIQKLLSAPRLNLGASAHGQVAPIPGQPAPPAKAPTNQLARIKASPEQMQAMWMEMARAITANTEDVGERFADEARKIHYREAPERGIRGVATPDQAAELADEGIEIMAFPLPEIAKSTLQ